MVHPPKGAVIASVRPGSLAEEAGLSPGDKLLKINGEEIRDLIDYYRLAASDHLLLEVEKDGETWTIEVEKDETEDLGLVFTEMVFDGIRQCQNHCLFCFVDQLPPGLRPSLYLKDDDYRLSFLGGTFVTLTNLTREDIERIKRLRLGPLYVSVHATHPPLRRAMLRHRRSGEIMAILRELAEAGITFHTQVVLCPGLNDGPALDQTIMDLVSLWPAVVSIATVPVGITRFRPPTPHLRPYGREEAIRVLRQVARWQETLLRTKGTRLVFAADEFYLVAQHPLPPEEAYEDYPQLENGVGLARLFLSQFESYRRKHRRSLNRPNRHCSAKPLLLVTGRLAEQIIRPLLRGEKNVTVLGIDNYFFGLTVTVTGLLVGKDISLQVRRFLATLPPQHRQFILLVPNIIFRNGGEVTLDGYSPSRLARETGLEIHLLPATGEALARFLQHGGDCLG